MVKRSMKAWQRPEKGAVSPSAPPVPARKAKTAGKSVKRGKRGR